MKEETLKLFDRSGQLMIESTTSRNRLYEVVIHADTIQYMQLTASSESSKLHVRLGYVNTETMKLMINKELVDGMPKITVEKETCIACLLGRQTRRSFPQSTSYRAKHPLELVHGDLCGPITPATPGQKRYVFVLIDDYTRYMWTVLLKEKSEALEKFKKFQVPCRTRNEKHL